MSLLLAKAALLPTTCPSSESLWVRRQRWTTPWLHLTSWWKKSSARWKDLATLWSSKTWCRQVRVCGLICVLCAVFFFFSLVCRIGDGVLSSLSLCFIPQHLTSACFHHHSAVSAQLPSIIYLFYWSYFWRLLYATINQNRKCIKIMANEFHGVWNMFPMLWTLLIIVCRRLLH